MNIEYVYINPLNPPTGYLEMLQKWYGKVKWEHFKNRQFEWYQTCPRYRIFTMKADGEFVGQAAAFGVDVYKNGRIIELWWGVDTFLFKQYRGGGRGKQLQKQLHDDLPNFTSAAYTPINGIIKNKCGCEPLFNKQEYYYGVSSFFSLLSSIFAYKVLKISLSVKSVIPYIYSFYRHKKYKNYEISDALIDSSLVGFINETLKSQYDFFVWRSVEYMKWKYEKNPAFHYKLLQFQNNGKTEAILGFTDSHEYCIGGKPVMSVKILDAIIDTNSKLSHKDLLVFVSDYYKQRKERIDGIFSLVKCNWNPRVFISHPVLSTLKEKVNKPYITFLDQDMEQVM